MDVVRLEARTDFRLEKLAGQPVWYVPADEDAEAALDMAWRRLTGAHRGEPHEIAVKGRVDARAGGRHGRGALFLRTICASSRSAPRDYLRIAHEFHTHHRRPHPGDGLSTQRNEAKRFIILIDTLYDHAVKLVASAAAEPDALYRRDRRLRGERVQAHRLAPDRDALAGISGAAARPQACGATGSTEGIVET